MNKTLFQKLLSAIPLRPGIAMVFTIILGVLGLFLPWVYLFITVQDAQGVITTMVLPQIEITWVFDLGYCEAFGANPLVRPPSWLGNSSLNEILRLLPVMIGVSYYFEFGPKKFKKIFWMLLLFACILLISFGPWGPERVICDFDTQVTIRGYIISWFSIFVPVVIALLGVYAYLKRRMIEKFEKPL
jgi:hypothetical protein